MSRATHYSLVCPECHEKTKGGHLVPPCIGEPAFWICAAINRQEQVGGMSKRRDWCAAGEVSL